MTDDERKALRARSETRWLQAQMKCLAHNLQIGAALCRAFRVGFDEGWNVTGEGFNAEYARFRSRTYDEMATRADNHTADYPEWRPGCGRSAP